MFRKLKHWIKHTFHFSNRESNGLLGIVLLIFLLIIAPKVYSLYYRSTYESLDHSSEIDFLEKNLTLLQENAAKSIRLDVNKATVSQLQALVGITEQLAKRIIGYRDKLGGFISVEQYKEVYGLSKRLQIRLGYCTTITADYTPKKLSLNKTNFKQLVSHPYISVSMAKAIINYRKEKGKFIDLHAIQNLPGYQADWGKKIMPYLIL